MGRLSGVVLDWYDDNGETLKGKFPTLASLPEVIKEADVRPQEKLTNEDFALVAIDEGSVLKKFACHDPGTTAMSVIYFMEHGGKLPHGAQKLAASNLVSKCQNFGMAPPPGLVKAAGLSDKEKRASTFKSELLDITGQKPALKVKVARSNHLEDYAVVLNGKGYYPIHSWDLVKKAESYFQEENIRMQPEVRRQYAVKLASKAKSMGYPLDPEIAEAGSTNWASSGHLKAAVEMRKTACSPKSDSRGFLDALFEKRASLEPEVYAEVLRRFDVQHGLDKGWNHLVLDPWSSTFGLNKTADVHWEDSTDRVTTDQLVNLAQNHLKRLREILTEAMCKEFQKDPMGIFDSMPLPQKKIISRLASDHPEQSEVTQAAV